MQSSNISESSTRCYGGGILWFGRSSRTGEAGDCQTPRLELGRQTQAGRLYTVATAHCMIVARKEAGTKVKCALRSLLPVKSTKAGARCVLVCYWLFVLPRPLR